MAILYTEIHQHNFLGNKYFLNEFENLENSYSKIYCDLLFSN